MFSGQVELILITKWFVEARIQGVISIHSRLSQLRAELLTQRKKTETSETMS